MVEPRGKGDGRWEEGREREIGKKDWEKYNERERETERPEGKEIGRGKT